MSLFIETIRIVNGRVMNIRYHNQRCNLTRRQHYLQAPGVNLREYIHLPKSHSEGLVKCRIIYGRDVEEVTYSFYNIQPISSLQLIYDDHIEYATKRLDRTDLIQCYEQRRGADDVIIVKDGLLTDTYYGNIALKREGQWFTPEAPLLGGTRRAQLLARQRIQPRSIAADDLEEYRYITIFNAMIPMGRIILPVDRIRK